MGCASAVLPSKEGVCVEVVDGDTCVLEIDKKHVVMRLVGIDAWEIHENQRLIRQVLSWKKRGYGVSYTQACQWGTNGWRHLQAMLPPGTPLRLKIYGQDRYGRALGSLFVSNDWINEKMVESGYAMVYVSTEKLSWEERKRLENAEKRARKASLGMWQVISP